MLVRAAVSTAPRQSAVVAPAAFAVPSRATLTTASARSVDARPMLRLDSQQARWSSQHRAFATAAAPEQNAVQAGSTTFIVLAALGLAGAWGASKLLSSEAAESDEIKALRKDIEALLDNPKWDDGSYGPVLIRLAWHASGTYDAKTRTGGSDGATMRFRPEASDGANAGLEKARALLEPLKKKYPNVSYADLWTLAGVVAIESASQNTIKVPWRPGRKDAASESACPPQGRLPDAAQGHNHVHDVFSRMGFSDRETVALLGAHALGRCHTDRSGFEGPWTHAPTMLSNEYYQLLLNEKWTVRKWNGPKQYQDPSGELMMLPAEIAMLERPEYRYWIEKYANDEELWLKDFAAACGKLFELGVKRN